MATKTKKQIKAKIANQQAKVQSLPKGSPERAKALDNLNKNLGLIGRPAVTANQVMSKAPAQVAQPQAPVAPTAYNSPNLPPEMNLSKPVEKLVDGQQEVADLKADQDVKLGTAGTQVNAFGSQNITRDPVTGEITQTQNLSGDQQKILDQGQNLTQTGQNLAQNTLGGFQAGFNPQTAQRTTSGDLGANRSRIESEVFGRLTRGMDEQKANDSQQMESTLRNRGIPLGSKQWNDRMGQLDKRYDTQRADAQSQAVEMGGNEYSRDFGINEQLIANQISQGQSVRNQNLTEASALQGMGTGLMTPEFTGYQGAQYQAPDVLGAANQVTNQQQGNRQLDIAQQVANQAKRPAGGGGAPAAPVATSPFNNNVAR